MNDRKENTIMVLFIIWLVCSLLFLASITINLHEIREEMTRFNDTGVVLHFADKEGSITPD